MIEISEENFQKEVLEEEKPVIVDFWANWCVPCQMMTPILEKISKEFGEKIKVVKINIDEAPSIASRYQIHAIPTLLFFKKGILIDEIVGVTSYEVLKEKIEKISKKHEK